MTTTCEQELPGLLSGCLDVVINRLSSLLAQLKPNGMSGFLLAHHCAIDGKTVWSNVLDFEADNITASELAIDSKVKHCEVACSPFDLKFGPDRRDVLATKRRLWADQFALIPRDAVVVP